jgi:tRNA modification GTPase
VRARTEAAVLAVHTKSDLLPDTAVRDDAWSYVSAESGVGLSPLLARIDAAVAMEDLSVTMDAIVVTRERHQRGLREARDEVAQFLEGWRTGALPATVAAVHLQAARDALAALVGTIGTEEILDRVFADFCIGK